MTNTMTRKSKLFVPFAILAIAVTFLFKSATVYAQDERKDYILRTLSKDEATKLRFVFNEAKIQFLGTQSNNTEIIVKKINASELEQIKVNRNGSDIEVSSLSSNSFEIIVRGSEISPQVFLKKGSVQIQSWKKDLMVVLQAGSLKSVETEGNSKFHVLNGQLSVGGHIGSLEVEGHELKTEIKNVKGDVSIYQHAGPSLLESIEGRMKISGEKGQFKVLSGSGDLDFTARQSGLQILNYKGSISGATEQGALAIQAVEVVDIRVQSKEGSVDIKVPEQSRASVDIQAQQAKVTAPKYLKALNTGEGWVARGQMKGNVPGRLSVRTQSGRVLLRTY